MTLDDLERPLCTLLHYMPVFRSPPQNLNADRPILSARKCSLVNAVSRDIRVMQIFAGIREIWGVKQESGRLRCMISLVVLT